MTKVTASAPGKLVLFGDHAVVHGQPCIVTAIDHRLSVTVSTQSETSFKLAAPDVGLLDYVKPLTQLTQDNVPKAVAFLEHLLKSFLDKYPQTQGITVETHSQFSSSFGFGSSSAVTVAFAKALSELFAIELTQKAIFDLAYEAVLGVQGVGSGFDIAAAIWGGTIYYVKPAAVVDQLDVTIPLIIGYTGIKADTPTLIRMVGELKDREPEKITQVFGEIGQITELAREAIKKKDWVTVGDLMNKNQVLLANLNVSSPELDTLISTSLEAGAFGAKLSGAGGGDCMIAVAPHARPVEAALAAARGEVMKVKTNAEGVRIDKKE